MESLTRRHHYNPGKVRRRQAGRHRNVVERQSPFRSDLPNWRSDPLADKPMLPITSVVRVCLGHLNRISANLVNPQL